MNTQRNKAALLCVTAAALVLGACNEKGLPGKNRELTQVQNAEWRYPIYETTPAASKVIELGGHTWQVTGATAQVPANMLQAVATVEGAQVYSLKSDKAPYDHLYTGGANGSYTLMANIN